MMEGMACSRAFGADRYDQRCISFVLLAYAFIAVIGLVHHFDFPQAVNQRNHIDHAVFIGFAGEALRFAVVMG